MNRKLAAGLILVGAPVAAALMACTTHTHQPPRPSATYVVVTSPASHHPSASKSRSPICRPTATTPSTSTSVTTSWAPSPTLPMRTSATPSLPVVLTSSSSPSSPSRVLSSTPKSASSSPSSGVGTATTATKPPRQLANTGAAITPLVELLLTFLVLGVVLLVIEAGCKRSKREH